MNKHTDFAIVKRYMESAQTVDQAHTAVKISARFRCKYYGKDYMAMKLSDFCRELLSVRNNMYKRVMTDQQFERYINQFRMVRGGV